MTLLNSSAYSDWLPDTDDDLDKGDRFDNLEETWTRTVEVLS